MGCYTCGESLSSYGFPIIDGQERHVCITCEGWKFRYEQKQMGTPNTFKVRDKVYVEFCGEWLPALIYSIEVVKTPKGDMCNYLCYYEHLYCFGNADETASLHRTQEIVEDFSWFETIKPRQESAVLIDTNGKQYNNITEKYQDEPRHFGELNTIKLPDKILKWIEKERLKQISLTLSPIKPQVNPSIKVEQKKVVITAQRTL